jgi:hypothetical protein
VEFQVAPGLGIGRIIAGFRLEFGHDPLTEIEVKE